MGKEPMHSQAEQMNLRDLSISEDGRTLWLDMTSGRRFQIPALQVRDLCDCGACRHANGQRLIDLAALPQDQRIAAVEVGVDHCSAIVTLLPESHRVELTFDRVAQLLSAPEAQLAGRVPEARLWDASLPESRFPKARYADIAGDSAALANWLVGIRDYGFALLEECGSTTGTVLSAVELFGFVRETNYGRLFDVVAKPDPNNLAYTGLGLGLHTDNPYRDPVPGMQFLHCLEASGQGGESLLVDGFRVAQDLRSDNPEVFEILANTSVPFRFTDSTADLRSSRPLIEIDGQGGLVGVRYNNRSRADLQLPPQQLTAFYQAYSVFGRLLHDPTYIISFKLNAGSLFVVDNRRVLHGRGAFSGGQRRLQGCYADWDALTSYVNLHQGAERR
ncbi:gamma-butyrobetaine hydroxylase [Limibacillus sp. MBR-115]|jgi:gamma-butyrobetaine dioxygenase